MGSRGQVVAWLDVTSFRTSSEERGVKRLSLAEVGAGGGGIAVEVGLGKVAAGVRELLMSVTFLVK